MKHDKKLNGHLDTVMYNSIINKDIFVRKCNVNVK
jgi:hypothetical protein